MLRKKANKEIDQMFLGMGVTGSVALSRPNRHAWMIRLVIFLLIVGILAAATYWFMFRSHLVLAKQMPKDSYAYINLSLPHSSDLYSQFLFWKNKSVPSKETLRVYQKLNLIELGNYNFFEDIFPLIAGKLEAGVFLSGEKVITAKLKNKDHWFNIFNLQAQNYNGELIEISTSTPNKDQWYWFIQKNSVYITNNALIKDRLVNLSRNESLASNLKGIGNNLGIIYINNSSILENNKYLKLLKNQASYPLTIFIKQEKDKIVFTNSKNIELGTSEINNTQVIRYNSVSDRELMLYFDDLGKALGVYNKDIASNLGSISELSNLLKSLYDIDTQDIAQKFSRKSAILSITSKENITENDWTLVIKDKPEDQDNTQEVLKAIAMQFFALNHPISIEEKLKDGSIMVELRAETDGLEWDQTNWDYNGLEVGLSSLQGTGEMNGYYIGNINDVGVVLSSSLHHLEQTVAKLDKKDQQNNENELCHISKAGIGMAFSINFFEGDEFLNNLINYITINSLDDNKFLGCIFFE